MAQTVYADKTSLTGGLASSLDGIDGALLLDGDMALVTTAEVLYIFRLDDNLGGAESSPRRILPDTNPGTKVWVLQKACIDGVTIVGGAAKTLTVTQDTSLDEAVAMSSKAPKTATIAGDGTAGRVLRVLRINIANGGLANTLKCTTSSLWNGDANGLVDNIEKGATTGVYTLNVAGNQLTLLNTGISGDVIAVISANITYNASTMPVYVYTAISGGIAMGLIKMVDGNLQDITALVDTGLFEIDIAYVTSA